VSDEEGFREYLEQSVDGCQEVIYTFQAKLALLSSNNEDAMSEELGEEGTVEQRAYFAILADVRDLLDALLPMSHGVPVEGLTAEEVSILASGGDGGPFNPQDDSTFPATLPSEESIRQDIETALGRSLFGSAWASAVELARDIGETGDVDAPNLSGCEILDHAPETSESAQAEARRILATLRYDQGTVKLSNRDEGRVFLSGPELGRFFLDHVLPAARAASGDDTLDASETAEAFGHALMGEAIGHGFGWTDDFPPHGLLVASSEFMEAFSFPLSEQGAEARGSGHCPELQDGERALTRGSRIGESYIVSTDENGESRVTVYGNA
jgi:hypothetical protein